VTRRFAAVAAQLALAALVAAGAGCRAAANAQAPPPPSPTPADGEPAAWSLPEPDLGYNARQGRELFAHYCATCHGTEGRGDGFNAYSLDPKPRDLGDPAFQASRSDADLAGVIRSGGGVAGLSNAMPPWGHTLNERAISNLVVFLRTLKAEPEPAPP
jgi:mono/diheme cytochrome c family protein